MNVNSHNLPSELSFGDYTWGDSNYEGGQLFMKCTTDLKALPVASIDNRYLAGNLRNC